jgi:hypothetical protein
MRPHSNLPFFENHLARVKFLESRNLLSILAPSDPLENLRGRERGRLTVFRVVGEGESP